MLPQIASLADTRGVLRLSGQELVAFLQVCPNLSSLKMRLLGRFDHTSRTPAHSFAPTLQGLLTNDTKQLEAKDMRMQYAAILNSHGRYLHDLFLHKQKGLPAHSVTVQPSQQTVCHIPVNPKPYMSCGVGDDLVFLADVDKHGATDLVKLLNR